MTLSTRHTYGWMLGRWLVTLQIEPIEHSVSVAPTDGDDGIDWDALAEQYGIPVNAEATGLQLCANCGQSVALGTHKFVNRRLLDGFEVRLQAGYRFPAGAYLCASCNHPFPIPNESQPHT